MPLRLPKTLPRHHHHHRLKHKTNGRCRTHAEWDEDVATDDNVAEDVTIRQKNTTAIGDSPTAEPAPHQSAGNTTSAPKMETGRGTNTTGSGSTSPAEQETMTQPRVHNRNQKAPKRKGKNNQPELPGNSPIRDIAPPRQD